MVAGRLRPGSAADLTMAVLFLAATVIVATLIVHELTAIRGPNGPPPATAVPAVAPASLPSLSIAVSVLPLPDGQELRVGDSIDKVTQVLRDAVETAEPAVQDGRIGRRITRRYRYGTLGFTVVFEAFEQKGELRVAAIYIQ
jgi:hypothetical protein